jgi:hypothetical protein
MADLDRALRMPAFEFLAEQTSIHGDVLPWHVPRLQFPTLVMRAGTQCGRRPGPGPQASGPTQTQSWVQPLAVHRSMVQPLPSLQSWSVVQGASGTQVSVVRSHAWPRKVSQPGGQMGCTST